MNPAARKRLVMDENQMFMKKLLVLDQKIAVKHMRSWPCLFYGAAFPFPSQGSCSGGRCQAIARAVRGFGQSEWSDGSTSRQENIRIAPKISTKSFGMSFLYAWTSLFMK